jgi:site-specific DNA recombinase
VYKEPLTRQNIMVKRVENKNIAIGYCRVSTDDQADSGISLDYQEEQCRNTANKDGFSRIKILRDEGKSGTSIDKRPGMIKLLEMAREKEFSALYVTHSDRLARNVVEHVVIRDTLKRNDIKLHYLNGQSSGSDATSVLNDNMFATINQYHSDITREKTKQATDAKVKAGYLPTCAPVGYLNVDNPDKNCKKVAKKIIVPDPQRAPLITEAFELYATGQYNVDELNDLMYKKGLTSKSNKKLSLSMAHRMLKNRLYIGEIHWHDIHVKKGKHKHLVDVNLFNKVQEVLKTNAGNRCRRRKYFWLLSGFVFCPTHNRRYTAEWHLKKGIAYYHCSNKSGCGKYIEKNKLENMVAEKFKTINFSEDFINLVIEKVKNIFEERKNNYSGKLRSLVGKKSAWEAKLKTAEERLLDGTLLKEDYLRIRKSITKEINEIEKQIDSLPNKNNIDPKIISSVINFSKNIYKTYTRAPEKLQKKILGIFFEKFDVKDEVILNFSYSQLFEQLIAINEVFTNSPNTNLAFENKGYGKVILSPKMGAYPDSNRN